eukprot:8857284-Karenia_brevis.AAC.1
MPLGNIMEGIYIDDHLVVHVCNLSEINGNTRPDKELIEQSLSAYDSVGLPVAVSKSFGFGKLVDCAEAKADQTFTGFFGSGS